MTIQTTLPAARSSFRATIADLIGPTLHGQRTDTTAPVNPTAIVLCGLGAVIGLFIVVVAQGFGRRGDTTLALYTFWFGAVLLLVPLASRIAWPVLARGERIFLLVLLGEFMFLYKVFYSPSGFVNFDEMLHWMTAYDVLYRKQLFLENSLLPISPFYPALEILATALANLIRVDVFPAGVIMLALLRGTFLLTLFLLFERLTSSARIAATGAVIYMGCSTFVTFDAGFAYESLAVCLCVMTMLAETRITPNDPRSLVTPGMIIATLAVTHHMTAAWCAIYMMTLYILHALRRGSDRPNVGLILLVVMVALGLPLVWMNMRGNPLVSYMGPVLESGVDSLLEKLSGQSAPREMFVGQDGAAQPLGNRVLGVTYTLVIAIGLATGFFRALAYRVPVAVPGWRRLLWVARREWGDSRVFLLTLGAFGFPVSVAFRLSVNGWEIGNRMNTFVFISVGLVLAIAIVHYWQVQRTRFNIILVSGVLANIILGGVILGSGPRAIHSPYKVSADADSIEAMGIAAASWTKEWLGPGNRFVSDRVNRTLLATYGDQEIVSSLGDGVDESRVFLNKTISGDTLYHIKKGRLEYLFVDLRLTTGLAVMGEYYERHEGLDGPPFPEVLLKFDNADEAARVFDNGDIIIYNVSGFYAKK